MDACEGLLQNNMLKQQYEALRANYPCHVESRVVVQITDVVRPEDALDREEYLWRLARSCHDLTGENEEEYQNVFRMLNGLTLVIRCKPSFPIDRPTVKLICREPLFHPNVDKNTGEMRFGLIESDWCADITLTKLVETVKEILCVPDLSTTGNPEAAKMYVENREEYYYGCVIDVIYDVP